MTVKTTGAEFKRFYSDLDFWPEDDGKTYHEDEDIIVNGKEFCDDDESISIDDTATVTISGGIVLSQKWLDEDAPSLETYFKRWRKKQATAYLVVEVERSREGELRAAILAAGGKISKGSA